MDSLLNQVENMQNMTLYDVITFVLDIVGVQVLF